MNLIVLGPQGSGKGTQAAFLAKEFDLEHVDMGAYLRRVAEQDTPLGKEVYRIQNVEKGLVPSRILEKVLKIKIGGLPREKGIVFDGVPRKIEQMNYLDKLISETGREISAVVFINISDGSAIKRTSLRRVCKKCGAKLIMGKDVKSENDACPKCGGEIFQREDDTPEGIKKRLEVFQKETLPVIENYRKRNLVLEIDGEGTIEEIREEIKKKVNDFN